jgi:hypothetical protein
MEPTMKVEMDERKRVRVVRDIVLGKKATGELDIVPAGWEGEITVPAGWEGEITRFRPDGPSLLRKDWSEIPLRNRSLFDGSLEEIQ